MGPDVCNCMKLNATELARAVSHADEQAPKCLCHGSAVIQKHVRFVVAELGFHRLDAAWESMKEVAKRLHDNLRCTYHDALRRLSPRLL